MNLRTRQVWRGEEQIAMTPTEFILLSTLMSRSGDGLSPEELVREACGPQYAGVMFAVQRYI